MEHLKISDLKPQDRFRIVNPIALDDIFQYVGYNADFKTYDCLCLPFAQKFVFDKDDNQNFIIQKL